jgi:tRNA 2-selenouridine synthase SelU
MKVLDEVLEQGMKGFSVKEFKSLINDDIIVLDTRAETEFVKGFVPGSINMA